LYFRFPLSLRVVEGMISDDSRNFFFAGERPIDGDPPPRRAVLAADVGGYSRLQGARTGWALATAA
jgi:hypothetical protein